MELKLAVQKLCGMMGNGAPLNGMCGPVSKLTAHMTINIAVISWQLTEINMTMPCNYIKLGILLWRYNKQALQTFWIHTSHDCMNTSHDCMNIATPWQLPQINTRTAAISSAWFGHHLQVEINFIPRFGLLILPHKDNSSSRVCTFTWSICTSTCCRELNCGVASIELHVWGGL